MGRMCAPGGRYRFCRGGRFGSTPIIGEFSLLQIAECSREFTSDSGGCELVSGQQRGYWLYRLGTTATLALRWLIRRI